MNCSLPKITFLTLRTLLLVKLCEVIYLSIDIAVENVFSNTASDYCDDPKFQLLLKSLSLKRVESRTFSVVYQSSIAFNLSSVLRRKALEVAYQILDEFHQKNINFHQEDIEATECVLSNFAGRVFSNGLIQFELSDRGLSAWLQSLVKPPLHARPNTDKSSPSPISSLEGKKKLFVCQHSHARCCSLLRLAHGSVITLQRLDNSPDNPLMISTPDPIPWLTEQGHLSLTHPAERRLISQIVTITDDFSDLMTNSHACLASATLFSQAFQDFHQACRIFGAASDSSRQLSQGRLGLVMIAQRLLNQLIEVGLGECAPYEL